MIEKVWADIERIVLVAREPMVMDRGAYESLADARARAIALREVGPKLLC